ncbi:MAG: hypothetical protein K6A80_03460 [Saccharofermentans sp.]|nr:hypothetical protein [Saccharofermentans sp.]
MIGLLIFIAGAIIVAVACVITFIISKLVYDRHNNKILAQGGNPSGKRSRMLHPGIVTLIVGVFLTVALAVGGTLMMSLIVIYDNIASQRDPYFAQIGDYEEDVPYIDVVYVRAGEYEPEESLYAFETSSGDNDFECSLYIRKDPFDNHNPLYVIVCSYSGHENAAVIGADYLHGRSETGSLTQLEGHEHVIHTSLWHIEYPGTLQISLKDGDGANVIGRVAFALDGASVNK